MTEETKQKQPGKDSKGGDNSKIGQSSGSTTGAPLAASVLKKLFFDPVPGIVPYGEKTLPVNTELVDGWEGPWNYSPVSWSEPLEVIGVQIDSEDYLEYANLTTVGVSSSPYTPQTVPGLSKFGLSLEMLINEDLAKSGAVRSLIPVQSTIDQQSIATLLHISRIKNYCATLDEAPVLRLLLLHITMAPKSVACVNTRLPMEIVMNTETVRKECTAGWTLAVENTADGQIGYKSKTSTIRSVVLEEYVGMLQNRNGQNNYIKFGDDVVSIDDISFIPVKACWNGCTWTIPYIMSYTCTNWWNHARYYEVVAKAQEETEKDKRMRFRTIPKSSTVLVRGNYKHVCLVITDTTRASWGDMGFKLGPKFVAGRDGNNDFAKLVYCWLGRYKPKDGDDLCAKGDWNDTLLAYRQMCQRSSVQDMPKQILVKVSELATSMSAGYSVLSSYTSSVERERRKTLMEARSMKIGRRTVNLRDESDDFGSDQDEEIEDDEDQEEAEIESRISDEEEAAAVKMFKGGTSLESSAMSSSMLSSGTSANAHRTAVTQFLEKLDVRELADYHFKHTKARRTISRRNEQVTKNLLSYVTFMTSVKTKHGEDLTEAVKQLDKDDATRVEVVLEYERELTANTTKVKNLAQYISYIEDEIARRDDLDDGDIKEGPWAFNHGDADRDLMKYTAEQRKVVVSGFSQWRVSPLGQFQHGRVSLKTGTSKSPLMGVIAQENIQYHVQEAYHSYRILYACDVFEVFNTCDQDTFNSPQDIYYAMLANGSLVSGVANLLYCQLGLTIPDVNLISTMYKAIDPRTLALMELITDGFCVSQYGKVGLYVGSDSWLADITTAIGIKRAGLDVWYSGYCPFWYVNSLIEKFTGKEFKSNKMISQNTYYNGDDPGRDRGFV